MSILTSNVKQNNFNESKEMNLNNLQEEARDFLGTCKGQQKKLFYLWQYDRINGKEY